MQGFSLVSRFVSKLNSFGQTSPVRLAGTITGDVCTISIAVFGSELPLRRAAAHR
jgi:hypothetical protein